VPWSDRARLTTTLVAATLVPVAALVVVGLRLLQLEDESGGRRQRDRTELAAGRLALEIDQQLVATEEQLAAGNGLRFSIAGISATAVDPVLYQPTIRPAARPLPPAFRDAELEEFRDHDFDAAARAYRSFSETADPTLRGLALAGLARVRRLQHQPAAALDAFAALSRLDDVSLDDQPARLVAQQGRCKVFEDGGSAEPLHACAEELAGLLSEGTLTIDAATFNLYHDLLIRWNVPPPGADAVLRSEIAVRLWNNWRAGDLPPRGRRVVRTAKGAGVATWTGTASGPQVAVTTLAAFEASIASVASASSLEISVSDVDGERLIGPAPAPDALSLTPGTTRLPFVLSVRTAVSDPGNGSQRRLLLGGLIAAVLLVVIAASWLYHATSRELALARQQTEFVSAVTHEFRTPLTSMRHLLDVLVSRGAAVDDRRPQYYQLLTQETERLHRMVESLLSFGRLEAGAYAFDLQDLDPGQLAATVVEEFRAEPLARNRPIECGRSLHRMTVRADRDTLARALWNLLENAAKYSASEAPVRVSVEARAGAVAIVVADHGPGIPPAERQRIFDKFVRGTNATEDRIRGVGIGLALVKRIVNAHGGSVTIDSELGRGSTFTILLPASPAATLGLSAAPAEAPSSGPAA
jgi:signal transduction histidine kinase